VRAKSPCNGWQELASDSLKKSKRKKREKIPKVPKNYFKIVKFVHVDNFLSKLAQRATLANYQKIYD